MTNVPEDTDSYRKIRTVTGKRVEVFETEAESKFLWSHEFKIFIRFQVYFVLCTPLGDLLENRDGLYSFKGGGEMVLTHSK